MSLPLDYMPVDDHRLVEQLGMVAFSWVFLSKSNFCLENVCCDLALYIFKDNLIVIRNLSFLTHVKLQIPLHRLRKCPKIIIKLQ